MSADGARRCGVLGSPIAHSLSPVLHRAAYTALGLDWQYDAHDVPKGELAGFLAGLSAEWRGLSLTMPLKRAVIGLLDEVEPLADTLQSVNTVLLEPQGRKVGYNTDVSGLVSALASHGVLSIETAVVLGGGATAASAVAAARHMGARRVDVAVRSPDRSAWLREVGTQLGVDVRIRELSTLQHVDRVDLVVSTLPSSAHRTVVTDVHRLEGPVFDVVYDPWPTPLVSGLQALDHHVIGGFDLLLHQAARQVELMAGVAAAPLEEMRAAGLKALDNRA